MEPVEGENLKTRVRREAAPAGGGGPHLRPCRRALAYAQAQGSASGHQGAERPPHPDGGVKLADFGIARSLESDGQPGLTRTDMLGQGADYLSPSRPTAARSTRARTSTRSASSSTSASPARCRSAATGSWRGGEGHRVESPGDPRAANPAVPDWLAAVTMRAAAKDPAHRYPDAAAMVAALEAGADGDGRPATPGDRAGARRGHGLPSLPAAPAADARAAARRPRSPPGRSRRSCCSSRRPATARRPPPCRSSSRRSATTTPGRGPERASGPRGAAIDGDPETAWYTENYEVAPEFEG